MDLTLYAQTYRASKPGRQQQLNARITDVEWLRWLRRPASGMGLLLKGDIILDRGLAWLAATVIASAPTAAASGSRSPCT